jgi:glutaredoxin
MARGSKGKYDTHVKPRLETIRAWKRHGLYDKQIAQNLKISNESFCKYKREHPEFAEVLKESLEDAVAQVENAHFKMAIGYEYEEKEITKDERGRTRVKITKKQVVPSVTAQIHYLKRRASSQWNEPSTKGDGHNGDVEYNVTLDEGA